MRTWDDVIESLRIRPGGGYARLAKRLQMDRSRLSAILRGRAMPAFTTRTMKPPELDRLARVLRLSKSDVERIAKNTMEARR